MHKKPSGFFSDVLFSCKKKCPVCGKGKIITRKLDIVKTCPECKALLGKHDMGDGATVFLLFILCFSIVPIILIIESIFSPPLWMDAVSAFVIGIAMLLVLMPIIKTYILLLEYRHRSGKDWEV